MYKNIVIFGNLLATVAIAGYLFIGPKPSNVNVESGSEEQMKQFILNNPEVIMQSVEQHQVKKYQEEMKKSGQAVKDHLKEIQENPNDPKAGSASASVKIVEFFDYNCGYCKRMQPLKEKILSDLKDVQIIFKELPILGENSKVAAKAALAVHMVAPDKYFAFHSAFLKHNGPKSEQFIEETCKSLGIDFAKVKETMNSAKVEEVINENHKLAEKIGVNGTPAYIINDEFIPGALSYEEVKSRVDSAKK